jgi:uncharacterized membrane protein
MNRNRIWALIGGLTVGAGLMYLLDPRYGSRRRALIRRRMTPHLHPVEGLREAGRKMEAHASLSVRAPIERVFEYWDNFQNFPRFMSHVLEVSRTEDGRSHWKVEGPLGIPVTIDTVITEYVPHRTIAWESLPGSTIETSGRVQFTPEDGTGTRVLVFMVYRPPAGALGRAVGALLGPDPQRVLHENLTRMQTLIESAESPLNPEGDPIARWEDESPQNLSWDASPERATKSF